MQKQVGYTSIRATIIPIEEVIQVTSEVDLPDLLRSGHLPMLDW